MAYVFGSVLFFLGSILFLPGLQTDSTEYLLRGTNLSYESFVSGFMTYIFPGVGTTKEAMETHVLKRPAVACDRRSLLTD
jgi:hypothetical protein